MYDGMTNGTRSAQRSTRRPGTSVRATSQANTAPRGVASSVATPATTRELRPASTRPGVASAARTNATVHSPVELRKAASSSRSTG